MATLKGGDKLADVLKTIGAKASKAKSVQVGFLENSTYPDGTSVPMVAAIQEFGAPKVGIPPRPYFRNMIAAKSKQWPKATAELLKDNDYDAAKTLGLVGEGVKGQLQQSIVDTNTPPNAPATIARKGAAKPLVDSGHMLNSIDYQVKT